jgi:hypothetical protein
MPLGIAGPEPVGITVSVTPPFAVEHGSSR